MLRHRHDANQTCLGKTTKSGWSTKRDIANPRAHELNTSAISAMNCCSANHIPVDATNRLGHLSTHMALTQTRKDLSQYLPNLHEHSIANPYAFRPKASLNGIMGIYANHMRVDLTPIWTRRAQMSGANPHARKPKSGKSLIFIVVWRFLSIALTPRMQKLPR
mgnify:CR=1 FL=1